MTVRALIWTVFLVSAAACDASFVDLRPQGLGSGTADAGFLDVGQAPGDGGANARTPVSVANWSGVGSYSATGTATIYVEGGIGYIELSSDFTVSRVPGPVLVLTQRAAIGASLDPAAGDVELGAVSSADAGARFMVPASAVNHGVVWVFCKPFGVEIARGELVSGG